jgi:hypothetical protein
MRAGQPKLSLERLDPSGRRWAQTYLIEFLLEMWRQLKTKLAVVLIDDIQNFSTIPQIMDIMRLVMGPS